MCATVAVHMSKSLSVLGGLVLLCMLLFAIFVHPGLYYTRGPDETEETAAAYASFVTSSTTPGALHIPIFIYHSVRPDFLGESKQQKQYSITTE